MASTCCSCCCWPKCVQCDITFTVHDIACSQIQQNNWFAREVERLKEEINSRDVRINRAQNKLKTEMDNHQVQYHCFIGLFKRNYNLLPRKLQMNIYIHVLYL